MTKIRKKRSTTALSLTGMLALSALAVGTLGLATAPSASAAAERVGDAPDWSEVTGANTTIEGTYLAGSFDMFDTDYSSTYIYANAGESVAIDLTRDFETHGTFSDDWDTPATVQILDPSGQVVESEDLPQGEFGDTPYELSGRYTSDTSGVWEIRVTSFQRPSTGGTSAADDRHPFVGWNIAVFADETSTQAIPGRVFSDAWGLTQNRKDGFYQTTPEPEFLADITFHALNATGVQYEVTLRDFNGMDSLFSLDNLGVVNSGSADCTPVNTSTPDNTSPEDNGAGQSTIMASIADDPACDNLASYRLFLDEPDPSIPAEIENWADGRTTNRAGYNEYASPEFSDLTFDRTSTLTAAGVLSGNSTQSGSAVFRIDTDGNGSFDDPVDVEAPFTIGDTGSYSYEWDGLDGEGNPVPADRNQVNFELELLETSPLYATRADVEVSLGGIEIIQSSGPNVGEDRIYWDDTPLTRDDDERYSTTPEITGEGVPSTGGVHGWAGTDDADLPGFNPNDGERGSWGDRRYIVDRAFIDDPAFDTFVLDPLEPGQVQANKVLVGDPVVDRAAGTVTADWDLEVRNGGSTTVEEIVGHETYPEGTDPELVEVVGEPSQGEFDTVAGEWQVGTLEPGESATVTLRTVKTDLPALPEPLQVSMINLFAADAPRHPADPAESCVPQDVIDDDADQCDVVEVPLVDNRSDLKVDKAEVGEPVLNDAGDAATITWDIQVGVEGEYPIDEVTVSEAYPAEVDPSSVEIVEDPSQGEFDTATGVWTVGTVEAGAVHTVTISGVVPVTEAGGTIVNTVTAGAPGYPSTGEDCVANATLTEDDDQCDVVETELPNPPADPVEPAGAADPGKPVVDTGDAEGTGPNAALLGLGAAALLAAGLGTGGVLYNRRRRAEGAEDSGSAPLV